MWANESSLAAHQQSLKENFAILTDELVSVAGWGAVHCSQTFETLPADSLYYFFFSILFYFPKGFRMLGNTWLEITSLAVTITKRAS